MVVNGATKFKDMKHFDKQLEVFKSANPGADVKYEYLHTQNLVAVQGPGAVAAVSKLVPSNMVERVSKMAFMSGIRTTVAGVPCSVTRCGYTGEDGYEIGMAAADALKVTEALLAQQGVLPAGLGPRDSLRLEAGLCLYGNDIDDYITPNEAALTWTIGKSRRATGGFLGSDIILKQLKEKSWKKRRVGLSVQGAPARDGAKIYTRPANNSTNPADATLIGNVTSGTFSPCLKAPIAMGYVATPNAVEGTQLSVEVRGKLVPCVVSKMPWVPHRYFKPAKA
jgi:aminomethyltransferase